MNKGNIVCACTGTTMEEIERAVEEGARTFPEVQEALKVGVQCVKCKDMISFLVDSLIEEE